MIKQAGIVECEKCGATEELIAKIGCYNEIEYWLPNGWGMDYDKHMMLCPECLACISAREGDNVVESNGKE